MHGRANEARFHTRGYIEEGTTPFDMVVCNKISRYHLTIEALKHVARIRSRASEVIAFFNRKRYEPQVYTRDHLQDLPEIAHWKWTDDLSDPYAPGVAQGPSKSVFIDA